MKHDRDRAASDWLSQSLGWFSIGLGVCEIVVPRQLSRLIGVDEKPALMRWLGVRETISGVGILAQQHRAWTWSRVAGDGVDLALLGIAIGSNNGKKRKTIAATAAVAGVTALDIFAGIRATRSASRRVSRTAITVNRSQADAFEFWRIPANLERFIKSVPTGVEIVTERPNEFIEWRSRDGKTVRSGSVTFKPAPGRKGTEVMIETLGLIPARLLHEDIRRFKRLLETGEIPTTEGQPSGPRSTALVSRVVRKLEQKGAA